ncbi:hypothetical protein E2562_016339 [Oryza meyeriana var. granulata]|uniref:Uncharacterized protein n=1 Tax=Oryza meyeriana var. granulata TaxID=110450 RepID=A0A6G1DX20_9ORYZ|nr:hypothetical protein E2562_016339 [Oryza meyeriana var. granulata]
MAEQPPPVVEAPEVEGKMSGGAWRRGQQGYQNPPEHGWQEGQRWPNPPDNANPDPATPREQWQFASRRFSRWYSRT